MATTILDGDGVRTVDARIESDRVLVEPGRLFEAIGWDLEPEGLCRDDRCVPVRDPAAIRHGGVVDVVAVATLLGSRTLLDPEAAVLAVGIPSGRRLQALRGRVAPDFELPDLEGVAARLSDWRGRRRLLVAFASW